MEEVLGRKITPVTRRKFLHTSAAGAAALLWESWGNQAKADAVLEPTPECLETEDNTEGPFYKEGAPERSLFVEQGMPGTRLTVSGRVLSTRCVPLAGALLDIWQADDRGRYDNAGFRLRGRLYADRSGRYELQTIVPGRYTTGSRNIYRPAHIHVKVNAPGFAPLTTQLYFKGDPSNATDSLVRPSLVMALSDAAGGGKAASFGFVLSPV